MYSVEGQIYNSFLAAIGAAEKIGANVIMVSNGSVKWSPAPQVSRKKMRKYQNQLAAYNAQQQLAK